VEAAYAPGLWPDPARHSTSYSSTVVHCVQFLYIKCYVCSNKPVLFLTTAAVSLHAHPQLKSAASTKAVHTAPAETAYEDRPLTSSTVLGGGPVEADYAPGSWPVPAQEAKYEERWPNMTSAWAGWSRFDIPGIGMVEHIPY
jgi:hypothetical protein